MTTHPSSPTVPCATPTVEVDERYSREEIVEALDAVDWFKKFLLDRFGAYTRTGAATDTRGRQVAAVADPHRPTSGGYGQWRLGRDWEDFARGTRDTVTFRHYLEADRGAGTFTADVVVPGTFILHDGEDFASYAQFQRLKAIWEPDTRA